MPIIRLAGCAPQLPGPGSASLGQNVGPECSAAASLSQNVGSRGGVLVWDPYVAVPLLQALALRR
ncbi:hypothetical protein EMIHUDRAFT_217955 [Emiliania huxleyi CCMP1516]|uniref:Uncharacterized protein n=2 Tax=Emiliania huxleyi TaxID=2903 RepID=A0A0D3I9L1_EMIH1|nr:hypothetical protein EMIHUDRAFT_217955 [Emiliania huxleyi CCMP1516]EOD07946.1 hypothetical protein EMIHUDRAFT_217955 [Emiliania huxleyi CCMP1516]|eukprot:XP_005760375.1 hypothetical protein EMIHUDRAFT_217955 [Emiliania huxleyi CCMP1516]